MSRMIMFGAVAVALLGAVIGTYRQPITNTLERMTADPVAGMPMPESQYIRSPGETFLLPWITGW